MRKLEQALRVARRRDTLEIERLQSEKIWRVVRLTAPAELGRFSE
jgi:hypothetical protein